MARKKKNENLGAPTKKTTERVRVLLSALERALLVKRACDLAMISYDTFYRWLKEDETFLIQVREAKSKAIERLVGKVEDKDPWKILKNADSEHFKDNVEVNSTERYIYEIDSGDGDTDEFSGY